MRVRIWASIEPMSGDRPVKAVLPLVFMGAFAGSAQAGSFEVLGYAGVLGEWELSATVTEDVSQAGKEFSGPLTMRHVGICSQDGPEEKTGEIRFRMSPAAAPSNATIVIAGETCSYKGSFSESRPGTIACPDKGPVPLTLWLK
jgi:hypothetical protein